MWDDLDTIGELREMLMTWRSITDDPPLEDGTGVLIYCPGYPGEVQAAVWKPAREEWVMLGCESLSFPFEGDEWPTHWMPLPQPPEVNE